MPTENRSSNTDMISVPRDLAEEICNGLRITQERGVKELRAILAQPAEQHHGEPVAYAVFADNGNIRIWSTNCEAVGIKVMQEEGKHAVPLFTHATPGEVERLRDDLDECDGERWKLRNERDTLRAQLAERDALLEEAYRDGWNDGQEAIEQRYQTTPRTSTDGWERFKAANALSASAKPSAPVERDALSPDEINQMAFEEGQPAEGGDGYTFTQEEFDLFVQRLLDRAALEHKPAGADDLAAFNAAFQKAMETGWDDPIDLARQLWNARGDLERKPALDTKLIGIVHTPPAEYDKP